MAKYKLYVRDSGLSKVGEIDDFGKLDLISRFNQPGSFALDVPAGTDIASYLSVKGAGLILERDDLVDPIFSGPVIIKIKDWNKDQNRLTVSGPDDTIWLTRRLAYPVVTGPPYSAQAHDVRTGVCETIMRQYVNLNAGPGANTERQVTGLTLAADTTLGSSITGRARFNNLLEFLQGLALAGGDLGFRIVQSGSDIEFQVYQPTDKTATIIFSEELGNLRAYEYSVEAAEANYFIAGGGGEGVARTFQEKGDSQSIVDWGRIEQFRDRRDTTDTDELIQTIDEELLSKAEKTNLSTTPINTDAIAFLTDYGLGDKVTVMVDGEAIQDVIREVKITLTRDKGEVVTPTIGTPKL